jgi:hypothetical protein
MNIRKRTSILITGVFLIAISPLAALTGETPEAQLFAEGLTMGNNYICSELLSDPEVHINLNRDFNDLLMKHVFSAAFSGQEVFVYNREKSYPYYLRVGCIRNAKLLYEEGISITNIDIWRFFPTEWHPEAEALARAFHEVSPVSSWSQWAKSATSRNEHYHVWLTSLGFSMGEIQDLTGRISYDHSHFTDGELVAKLKNYEDMWEIYSVCDELLERCVSGEFTDGDSLFESYKNFNSNSERFICREVRIMLYALGDRRIIPSLFKDTTSREEPLRYRFLIKKLDPVLYATLFIEAEDHGLNEYELVFDVLRDLAGILEPYYMGEALLYDVVSNAKSYYSESLQLAGDYAVHFDEYLSQVENALPEMEETLRFGTGNERYRAIENLCRIDKGISFLKEYLFVTWDPDIFTAITSCIVFEEGDLSQETIESAKLKWKDRSSYESYDVRKYLEKL